MLSSALDRTPCGHLTDRHNNIRKCEHSSKLSDRCTRGDRQKEKTKEEKWHANIGYWSGTINIWKLIKQGINFKGDKQLSCTKVSLNMCF